MTLKAKGWEEGYAGAVPMKGEGKGGLGGKRVKRQQSVKKVFLRPLGRCCVQPSVGSIRSLDFLAFLSHWLRACGAVGGGT